MARLSSSSCLQEQLGLTFIIVTHGQQGAMTVASRIGAGERMKLASDTAGRLRAAQAAAGRPGGTDWVALRPEKIRISHEQPASATSGISETCRSTR
jgi:hypothetical protein